MIIKFWFIDFRTGKDAAEVDFNKQLEKNRKEYAENREKRSAFELTPYKGNQDGAEKRKEVEQAAERFIGSSVIAREEERKRVLASSVPVLCRAGKIAPRVEESPRQKEETSLIARVKSLREHMKEKEERNETKAYLKALKEKYGIYHKKAKKSQGNPQRTANKPIPKGRAALSVQNNKDVSIRKGSR